MSPCASIISELQDITVNNMLYGLSVYSINKNHSSSNNFNHLEAPQQAASMLH